jgi:hypothetical protein
VVVDRAMNDQDLIGDILFGVKTVAVESHGDR